MRTVTDIFNILKASYVAERAAAGLVADDPANWSKVNLKRLFYWVIAYCLFLQEAIFAQHKLDTDSNLKELKPHSTKWYENKALAFQLGFNLLDDSDEYDNTGKSDAEITASKIVAYSSVTKQDNQYGRRFLRMKLAGLSGGDLTPLTTGNVNAIKNYFNKVGDAGVKLVIESLPADSFKSTLTIYYNPLLLNAAGERLDGSDNTPVQTAIDVFLKSQTFNGVIQFQKYIDAVQAVEGVETLDYQASEQLVKYGSLPYQTFGASYVPDAGYLRFINPSDLTLIFTPYGL